MTPKQFEQLIKTNAKQLAKAFERTIPVKVGVAAEQHFKDNFRKGGFVNGGLKAWKPAKHHVPTQENTYVSANVFPPLRPKNAFDFHTHIESRHR